MYNEDTKKCSRCETCSAIKVEQNSNIYFAYDGACFAAIFLLLLPTRNLLDWHWCVRDNQPVVSAPMLPDKCQKVEGESCSTGSTEDCCRAPLTCSPGTALSLGFFRFNSDVAFLALFAAPQTPHRATCVVHPQRVRRQLFCCYDARIIDVTMYSH